MGSSRPRPSSTAETWGIQLATRSATTPPSTEFKEGRLPAAPSSPTNSNDAAPIARAREHEPERKPGCESLVKEQDPEKNRDQAQTDENAGSKHR